MNENILDKANSLYGSLRYDDALELLNIYLRNPEELSRENILEGIYLLANCEQALGNIGKAIKNFNKVLEIEPGHIDASISLSILYNDIGKYEEAKKIYKVADKQAHQNTKTSNQPVNKVFSSKHFELAELYVTYERYDEALMEYSKSSALDPENIDIKLSIAKLYAQRGHASQAIDELRKLKVENPDYLKARTALGTIFFTMGDVIEAQKEWEKVLAKDPFNDEAKMYLNLSKTATETNLNI